MKSTWKFIDTNGETADFVIYNDNGTDTTVAQVLGQLQTTLADINGRLQQLESDTATMTATLDDHEDVEVLGIVQTATGGTGYGQFLTVDNQGQPLNAI